jgi:hypothetical protein
MLSGGLVQGSLGGGAGYHPLNNLLGLTPKKSPLVPLYEGGFRGISPAKQTIDRVHQPARGSEE